MWKLFTENKNENLRQDINCLQVSMNILKCHDQNLETENINLLMNMEEIDKSNQRAGVSREIQNP